MPTGTLWTHVPTVYSACPHLAHSKPSVPPEYPQNTLKWTPIGMVLIPNVPQWAHTLFTVLGPKARLLMKLPVGPNTEAQPEQMPGKY